MKERPTSIGFWHPGNNGVQGGPAVWMDNRYKLHKLSADNYELYDLIADPVETTNLAAGDPEVMQRMKIALEGWQESVIKSIRKDDYKTK
jgi:arylsulfatase A-like enzyme